MSGKKLAVTKKTFDELLPELKRGLQDFYDDETQTIVAPPHPTDAVNEDLPKLDSKSVVRASPVVEKILKIKLRPQFIKKGGYDSFEAFFEDIVPKLRQAYEKKSPETREPKVALAARSSKQ